MRIASTSPVALSVLLGFSLAGCSRAPTRTASDPILASADVVRELHETRPAFTELTKDEQAIVHLWLHAHCAVGFDERQARFIRPGTRLEAALIEALRMGPPVAFLGELSAARRSDHAAIRSQLESDEEPFGSPDLRTRLLTLSEERFLNDALHRAVISYRRAALEGLGLVGSQTAVAWLERTAQSFDPELRPAAERSLAAIRTRLRRWPSWGGGAAPGGVDRSSRSDRACPASRGRLERQPRLPELPDRCGLLRAHASNGDACLEIILAADRHSGEPANQRDLSNVGQRIGDGPLEQPFRRTAKRLGRRQPPVEGRQTGMEP